MISDLNSKKSNHVADNNQKRVVITYAAKDPINIRLESLMDKFEGFTLNELVKYAVIRLDESENSKLQTNTVHSEPSHNDVLQPIREQFKTWLLKKGYTNTQIESLTDEQVYEIIRKI